jgi:hypothetical protein
LPGAPRVEPQLRLQGRQVRRISHGSPSPPDWRSRLGGTTDAGTATHPLGPGQARWAPRDPGQGPVQRQLPREMIRSPGCKSVSHAAGTARS